MNESQARAAVRQLVADLRKLVEKDAEQEVRGPAVGVLDAVITSAKALYPNHEVVQAMPDPVSPEALIEGEPIRAADALVIAGQLKAAIGQPKYRARSF